MIRYFLIALGIQLLFLMLYDFLLKRETFFTWNRWYLLGSLMVSLGVPAIKIWSLRTAIPKLMVVQLPEVILTAEGQAASQSAMSEQLQTMAEQLPIWKQLSITGWVLFIGMAVALVLFLWKLVFLYRIHQKSTKFTFEGTLIHRIPQSRFVFSFWNRVYIGSEISEADYPALLQHEGVHIHQKHTIDMLFVEMLRVVFWFNPMVYLYQSRLRELHEYLADAVVEKAARKQHFQLLVSQLFGVHRMSFVHTFYHKKLIKKRIAMLRKQKSSPNRLWKYMLVLPALALGLLLNSCEQEIQQSAAIEEVANLQKQYPFLKIETNQEGGLEQFSFSQQQTNKEQREALNSFAVSRQYIEYIHIETYEDVENMQYLYSKTRLADHDSYLDLGGKNVKIFPKHDEKLEIQQISASDKVPFAVVDEVPVFPGCENEEDKKACFQKAIKKHIRKHFNYPAEAQTKGFQGKVFVMFVIDSEGNIRDIKKRGPNKMLEKEAERIINRLPKMTPGKHKGKVVAVPFSIPITFKLI